VCDPTSTHPCVYLKFNNAFGWAPFIGENGNDPVPVQCKHKSGPVDLVFANFGAQTVVNETNCNSGVVYEPTGSTFSPLTGVYQTVAMIPKVSGTCWRSPSSPLCTSQTDCTYESSGFPFTGLPTYKKPWSGFHVEFAPTANWPEGTSFVEATCKADLTLFRNIDRGEFQTPDLDKTVWEDLEIDIKFILCKGTSSQCGLVTDFNSISG